MNPKQVNILDTKLVKEIELEIKNRKYIQYNTTH